MTKIFSFLGIFILILFAVFVFSQKAPAVEAEKLITPIPQADPNQVVLDQLKTQRNSTNNTEQQNSLDGKINALEYKLSVQATAQSQPPKSLQEICANRVQLDVQPTERPLGILTVREDFLMPQGYEIQNMWRGMFNGLETEVYSGSLLEDKNQGIVIVSIPDLNIFQTIYDPQPQGSLTIQSAEELRLILNNENNSPRYFDIPAQQFTTDVLQVLPAADLPPIPTPIYDPCAQFDAP